MSQVRVQEQESREFFEVPARVLDIMRSFVDSSTKCEYYWNSAPYRKIMRDGSYWEVFRKDDEICMKAVSWRSEAVVCTNTVALELVVYRGGRYTKYAVDDARVSNAMLVSKCREFKVRLFDVLRKLYFYWWLM
ncbi:MAG: hypothetical protein QXM43_05690 [Desulfurococcaceae archaeon]